MYAHYDFSVNSMKVLAVETLKTSTSKLSLYESSLQSVLEILANSNP
jgi:hypothetical protein